MPRNHGGLDDATSSKSQYTEKLEALYQHAASLAAAETVEEVSDLTLEVMGRVLGFDFISFLMVVGGNLLPVSSRGAPMVESVIPIGGRGIVARTARTKTTQLVPDTRLDADFFAGSTASLSEIAVPVILDGSVLAVINAESVKPGAFNNDDVVLCELLASNIASAMHRIRSRERLSDAENLMTIMMNEITDGIYITDMENKVIEANNVTYSALGYTREEYIGSNIGRVETLESLSKYKFWRARLLETGRNLFETEVLTKNGDLIPVEVSTRRITYRGKPAIIGISRDLRERRKTEAALRESEQLYRTILETSPMSISISVDGRIVYANPSRMKLTGNNSIEEVNRTHWDFVHPDDVEKLKRLNIMDAEGGLPSQSYEYRLKTSVGVYAIIEALSTPIMYKEKPGVLHVLYDVTQRHQYEERLMALHGYARDLAAVDNIDSAAKVVGRVVQSMLESSFGSVGIIDGKLIRFVHVYGVDWDEGGTMPLDGTGITTRAARTGTTQVVGDVTQDKDYYFAKSDEATTRSEIVVPVKVGGEVVAVVNVENPRLNAYSQDDVSIMEMLGNHFSSAIERIRATEARVEYRRRLETLNNLVIQLDSAHTVAETGRIASNLLQSLFKSQHDNIAFVEGDHLVSYKPGPQTTPKLPLDGPGITIRSIREGRTIYVPDVNVDPDFVKGDIEAKSELVAPFRLRGRIIGVLNLESLLRDGFSAEDIKLAEALASHISATLDRIRLGEEQRESMAKALKEEAAAQRARETERMKTRFLSAATHEIRTPLTSINGYTNLIQEALAAGNLAKVNTYFGVVRRNAERLTRLTDELLDTQRLEERQMTLSRAPIRTHDLLGDVVREVTPFLSGRGQTLEVEDRFDEVVEVDADRMHQVISNLLNNASKFSPSGAKVWLRAEQRGSELLVSVRDEGLGISEEDKPKLFRPFPGIKVEGNREGTGLGLSICRGIVELHGGRIWVESEGKGRGSVFSFAIPLRGETA